MNNENKKKVNIGQTEVCKERKEETDRNKGRIRLKKDKSNERGDQ